MLKTKKHKKGAKAKESAAILNERSGWELREAYKTIRTNLVFMLPESSQKVIGITSALPHEGKTITSINLAISLSGIDKKVVLLECDMRRPTISGRLNAGGKHGLSNFLAGQADIKQCMTKTKEGFDLIPAGTIPPDPTVLLQSYRMKILLEELRNAYDFIILDFPPVDSVSDAVILSDDVDGYVIVIRHGQADTRAVRDMVDRMKLGQAQILGFIYNGTPAKNRGYYNRYGGYYGKYAYK